MKDLKKEILNLFNNQLWISKEWWTVLMLADNYPVQTNIAMFWESVPMYLNWKFGDKIGNLFRQQQKAYGGCEKCYGKGYSTRKSTEIGHEDFGGDGYVKDIDEMRFCNCERGEQLRKRLKQQKIKAVDEKIELKWKIRELQEDKIKLINISPSDGSTIYFGQVKYLEEIKKEIKDLQNQKTIL